MTAPDIVTEARRLRDAATPGDWRMMGDPDDDYIQIVKLPAPEDIPDDAKYVALRTIGDVVEPADAAFIAAAPRLVTDLVAEVQRLRHELDQRTDPDEAAYINGYNTAIEHVIAHARLLGGDQ